MTSHLNPNAVYGGTEYALAHRSSVADGMAMQTPGGLEAQAYMNGGIHSSLVPADPIIEGIADDLIFINPQHNFFQDMEFNAWDLNFDSFNIPQLEINGPSPQSTTTTTSKPSSRIIIPVDPSRGHAAFKRSPWLWDPESKDDYVRRDKEGLHLNEDTVTASPVFERFKPNRRMKMSSNTRDKLFAMVLAQNKDPTRVPPFPSLDILNFLLRAHFVQDEQRPDSWIHAPTFKPDETLLELLAAIIANGGTFISVPDIWKFGLAIQEVVRIALGPLFESKNSNTRDLNCLSGYMLNLEVGLWSGFKRKIELAESFGQPLITV